MHACRTCRFGTYPRKSIAELIRRGERAGKSLQQVLAEKLELIATTPTLEEILDRVEGRRKGRVGMEDAIEAIEDERARR